MKVEHISCGCPANQSEELVAERCVDALRPRGDGGRWVVLLGEACFFTLLDPEAPTLKGRGI